MSKQSKRRRKARAIKAAAESRKRITFECSGVDWINAEATEADKPKQFSMTAYTGGEMTVGYYNSPVIIDLAGLTAKAPLPILLGHDAGKIVGHADDISVEATSLVLSGVISGASAEADQVAASAKLGFPWKASVGVSPGKMEYIAEGAVAKVNGQQFKGPVYVARKATLGEVSFVPIAADNKTSTKVAARSATPNKERDMKFDKWLKALFGGEVPELTDQQTEKLQARYDNEQEPKVAAEKAPIKETFDAGAIVLACAKHSATLEARAAEYSGKIEAGKLATIASEAATVSAQIKSSALNEEWSAERMSLALVRAEADQQVALVQAERPTPPAVHGSTHDSSPDVIEAALCLSAGLRKPEDHFDEKILEAADKQYRNLGLQQFLLQAAFTNGYQVSAGSRIHSGNVREVLRFACPTAPVQAAGFSTLDVSGILSNTGNKMLLDGFNQIPQTWREVAAVQSVTDFKEVTRYRMTADLEYEELPATGEIKHGTLGEESYTIQARTYAKMLALTRTDIINDDLGAFNDLRTRLGMGAVLKMNKVFWTLWINNSSFFTSGRSNYQDGATTTLSEAGLNTAVKLFREMKGPDGNFLGLTPDRIVVPTALEATAKKINVSMELRDTTASTKTFTSNIYQGSFRPVSIAELGDSNYTGYSALAWYLLCDPAILATAAMCFLNGQQSPTIESADADFNTLGIQLRGYHDFGVNFSEYRAGVKSKGES